MTKIKANNKNQRTQKTAPLILALGLAIIVQPSIV
jgi:hypothetical protein